MLVLSAQLDIEQKIKLLDIGADDYLLTPFDVRELEARMRALVRRSCSPAKRRAAMS